MGKPWRCRVWFHKWVKTRKADGDYYRRCARCGTDKMGDYEEIPPYGGPFTGGGG
jgi:hypothetical protein